MEYQYVTSISAQKTVKNFSKTDETAEVGLSEQSGMIKNVCDKEFEICGAYNEQPFWDKPYSFRNEVMGRIKDKLETCTGKPMRIFGSK
jgi:hypothetical protein